MSCSFFFSSSSSLSSSSSSSRPSTLYHSSLLPLFHSFCGPRQRTFQFIKKKKGKKALYLWRTKRRRRQTIRSDNLLSASSRSPVILPALSALGRESGGQDSRHRHLSNTTSTTTGRRHCCSTQRGRGDGGWGGEEGLIDIYQPRSKDLSGGSSYQRRRQPHGPRVPRPYCWTGSGLSLNRKWRWQRARLWTWGQRHTHKHTHIHKPTWHTYTNIHTHTHTHTHAHTHTQTHGRHTHNITGQPPNKLWVNVCLRLLHYSLTHTHTHMHFDSVILMFPMVSSVAVAWRSQRLFDSIEGRCLPDCCSSLTSDPATSHHLSLTALQWSTCQTRPHRHFPNMLSVSHLTALAGIDPGNT